MQPPAQPALLTRRDSEPAGKNCVLGGIAIRAGLDRNGDGVLEAPEIDHTDYVCDVATAVLVRKDPLAPGLECPDGGIAVLTGIDDNNDGILEDAEIDQTTHLCNSLELWNGDFTSDDWKDPVKVAALQGARVVSGSLTITGDIPVTLPLLEVVDASLVVTTQTSPIALPSLQRVAVFLSVTTGSSALDLPALSEVDGNVFTQTGSSALDLPALRQVGGNVSVNPGSGTVTFDVLDRVHGELFITGNGARLAAPSLRTLDGPLVTYFQAHGDVSLPGLETIGGKVQLQGQITGLHLDHLVSIGGGINLERDPQVSFGLALPSLQTIAGDVTAELDAKLTSIDLPQLAHLGGSLKLDSVNGLTRISLPGTEDIAGDVSIQTANALETIDLGSLETVGSFEVLFTPALTTLSMPSLSIVRGTDPFSHSVSIGVDQTAIKEVDFASLRSVVGTIGFDDNPVLRTVKLPLLTAATNLAFDFNPAIETVIAPKITTLDDFSITEASLHTLDLGQLATVNFLQIAGATLPDLSGLRSLSSVGFLRLQHVDQLQDFRSLTSLSHVSTLDLEVLPALTSLDGLEQITHLSGELFLVANFALTSIAGLRNVTHIGDQLRLESNIALTDLTLTSLLTIGGLLEVRDMEALTSLSGLDALTSVGGDFDFLEDDKLPVADILAFEHRLGR